MRTIFDLCQPRLDVLQAQMRDEDFAADLSVRGMAIHRKKPRRVLAALWALLTAS